PTDRRRQFFIPIASPIRFLIKWCADCDYWRRADGTFILHLLGPGEGIETSGRTVAPDRGECPGVARVCSPGAKAGPCLRGKRRAGSIGAAPPGNPFCANIA